MISRLLWVGLLAGLLAGILSAGVQAVGTWPLIAQAETFEVADAAAAEEWSPEGMERTAWSVIFNLLAGVGFGLLANGALLILRSLRATSLDWRVGAIVGAVGFLTFALAPAFGLAPALPGMAEGDLVARQIWWLATAAATLSGAVLMALGRRTMDWLLGLALIAAPHVVGAPGEAMAFSASCRIRERWARAACPWALPSASRSRRLVRRPRSGLRSAWRRPGCSAALSRSAEAGQSDDLSFR